MYIIYLLWFINIYIIYCALLQVPEFIPPGKGGGGVGWKITNGGLGLEVEVAPGGGGGRFTFQKNLPRPGQAGARVSCPPHK